MILRGDLGIHDPVWAGWLLRNGSLHSPEGWEIKMADVLASRLHEMQLAAWRQEVAVLRQRVTELEGGHLEEQPTTDQWEVEILTG
jgi:hypothetical protein